MHPQKPRCLGLVSAGPGQRLPDRLSLPLDQGQNQAGPGALDSGLLLRRRQKRLLYQRRADGVRLTQE